MTEWSELFGFTATGGASVVQSVTLSPTRRATITWAPVAEAATYEVQIAWLGTNFDFLHPTGITVLSYTTTSALAPGNYRVWVRGVKADGTLLSWSKPFNFSVVSTDSLTPENSDGAMLVVLESALSVGETAAPQASETPAEQIEDTVAPEAAPKAEVGVVVTPESVPASFENSLDSEEAMLIEQLAQVCAKQEWWTVTEVATA